MHAGAKKHLEHHDLWDVNSYDQAAPVFKKFAGKLKGTRDPIKAPQVKFAIERGLISSLHVAVRNVSTCAIIAERF